MAQVILEKLTKVYANGTLALSELDLEVADGEFMVLVGPSGCGKTTALRMVAGLEEITGGAVRIGEQTVNHLSPKDRDVAMVFQNYALYPHMSVERNIGFALRLRKQPKDEVRNRVVAAAKVLGLLEHLERRPAQLSGGQRQRVAMGRAIVREPSVFLMDEPLSNLDAKLRVQMRAEISEIQRRVGVATLYVTHDQTEAMTMGDRVAVLRSGLLQQCAPPQQLYDRPANVFVAAFIGSPAMNLYEGVLSPDGESVKLGSQQLDVPRSVRDQRPALGSFRDSKVVVGVRPEDLSDAEMAPSAHDGAGLVGDVRLVEALGSELMVHFQIDASRVHSEDAVAANDGREELADLEASELATYATGVARVSTRSAIRESQRARFVVDTERLHFFDPASGEAIRD